MVFWTYRQSEFKGRNRPRGHQLNKPPLGLDLWSKDSHIFWFLYLLFDPISGCGQAWSDLFRWCLPLQFSLHQYVVLLNLNLWGFLTDNISETHYSNKIIALWSQTPESKGKDIRTIMKNSRGEGNICLSGMSVSWKKQSGLSAELLM